MCNRTHGYCNLWPKQLDDDFYVIFFMPPTTEILLFVTFFTLCDMQEIECLSFWLQIYLLWAWELGYARPSLNPSIFEFVKVAVHYYGRLAAKQGWRFDSTYDHKDENGEPSPFVFFLGSGKVSPDIINQIIYHF